MIDLVKSTLPTTYPYVIKKEFFIVQDARPLYHWPEKKITLTTHDNWEPQFKPKVIERPKSATVVAAAVPVDTKEDEEGEDSDIEDEDMLEDGSLEEKEDKQEVQQEEIYTGEEGLDREETMDGNYDEKEPDVLHEDEELVAVEEEGLEKEQEEMEENVEIPVE